LRRPPARTRLRVAGIHLPEKISTAVIFGLAKKG
jgi:hypothetical protein